MKKVLHMLFDTRFKIRIVRSERSGILFVGMGIFLDEGEYVLVRKAD